MPLFLVSALAFALALPDTSADSLTCTPAGYAQVQDGEEYDRVDCVAARQTNPQCADRRYAKSEMEVSHRAYTSSGDIPPQGEFLGHIRLSIDRRTGAFKFVVIATTADDPSWKNVKTFWGHCQNATNQLPH